MRIKTCFCFLPLLILTVHSSCLGQTVGHKRDKTIVSIRECYKGYGKLFDITENAMIDNLAISSSFLPSDQDIVMAEKIMRERYPELVRTDQRLKGSPEDFQRSYYDYYRQYCGIVTKAGERVIFVMLFSCCRRKAERCFPKWDKEVLSPLIDDPCVKMAWFDVNLTTDRISIN